MKIKGENYDLGKLLGPYANKWVALSRDRKKVIAEGNTLKEVVSKVKSKDTVLLKVFPSDSLYIPPGI